MPIYEYKCSDCSNEFETIQKFSDEPLTECPKCKGKVEKLVSKSSFQLKGSGWYSDGYGKTGGTGSSSGGSAPTGGGCGHGGGCSSC